MLVSRAWEGEDEELLFKGRKVSVTGDAGEVLESRHTTLGLQLTMLWGTPKIWSSALTTIKTSMSMQSITRICLLRL